MKKYLIIVFILALLFISGCQVPKTGRATATPTQTATSSPSGSPIPPPVTVYRYLPRGCSGTYTVTLAVSHKGLDNNEIMILAEKIPNGVRYVDGSWSVQPAFKDDNTITWLFAKTPPKTLGTQQITQKIPAKITYRVTNKPVSPFRGKWGLYINNTDGLIGGSSIC